MFLMGHRWAELPQNREWVFPSMAAVGLSPLIPSMAAVVSLFQPCLFLACCFIPNTLLNDLLAGILLFALALLVCNVTALPIFQNSSDSRLHPRAAFLLELHHLRSSTPPVSLVAAPILFLLSAFSAEKPLCAHPFFHLGTVLQQCKHFSQISPHFGRDYGSLKLPQPTSSFGESVARANVLALIHTSLFFGDPAFWRKVTAKSD